MLKLGDEFNEMEFAGEGLQDGIMSFF